MGIIDGIFRAGKMLQVGDGSFTSYAVNVYTDSINRSDHYVKGHPIVYYGMNGSKLDLCSDKVHEDHKNISIKMIGTLYRGAWNGVINTFYPEKRVVNKYPTVKWHEEYSNGKIHGIRKEFWSNKVLKRISWHQQGHGLNGSYTYEYNQYGQLTRKMLVTTQFEEAYGSITSDRYRPAGWGSYLTDVDLVDDNKDKSYEGIYVDN